MGISSDSELPHKEDFHIYYADEWAFVGEEELDRCCSPIRKVSGDVFWAGITTKK